MTTFLVRPNQLDRERPYIEDNIAMTRQAYGLDRFTQFEFPAETTVAAADPANNQATLQNIRLWDVQALQDTLRQVQEIRTYYDFPDIDIDRYQLNGSLREVMLAVRELNVDKLPESSHNWINDKLIYTHGYGITMNPVNGFTPEGLPTLLLSNMPVQSTVPGLEGRPIHRNRDENTTHKSAPFKLLDQIFTQSARPRFQTLYQNQFFTFYAPSPVSQRPTARIFA